MAQEYLEKFVPALNMLQYIFFMLLFSKECSNTHSIYPVLGGASRLYATTMPPHIRAMDIYRLF